MKNKYSKLWFSAELFSFIAKIFILRNINFDTKVCFLEIFSDKVHTISVYTFTLLLLFTSRNICCTFYFDV